MFRKRLAGKFYGLLRKTAIYIEVTLIKKLQINIPISER